MTDPAWLAARGVVGMRSCASGVARPWNNEQNAQKAVH